MKIIIPSFLVKLSIVILMNNLVNKELSFYNKGITLLFLENLFLTFFNSMIYTLIIKVNDLIIKVFYNQSISCFDDLLIKLIYKILS